MGCTPPPSHVQFQREALPSGESALSGHAVHAAWPRSAYEPAAHGGQVAAAGGELVPAAHSAHVSFAARNVPGRGFL